MKYKWNMTGIGQIDNLGLQLQKLARNMNENQLATRYRYLETNVRFIKFLAEEFKLKKLSNISNKHVEKYAKKLIEEGKAHKYIKNELSGIRFLHNHMSDTKYDLVDGAKFNKEIGLTATHDGRADRAWTEPEFKLFCDYAKTVDRKDIANIFEVIKVTGMRLDEICTLRKSEVDHALKTGKLHLTNTKGGIPRDVPLTPLSEKLLLDMSVNLRGTDYVFTPVHFVNTRTIHKYENQVQKFLYNHRSKFQDSDRNSSAHNVSKDERGPLTLHGLRHTYARNRYNDYIQKGRTEYEARKIVAKELGHGRDQVTLIYLAKGE